MTLANPAAGIEPVRRAAVHAGDGHWRVDGLRIPVAGQWIVRVDLLIDDFDKIVLEDRSTCRGCLSSMYPGWAQRILDDPSRLPWIAFALRDQTAAALSIPPLARNSSSQWMW